MCRRLCLALCCLFLLGVLAHRPNQEARDQITSLHNNARANVYPPAKNPIPNLSYNSNDLETIASDYANLCTWAHNPERGANIGENLAAFTGVYTESDLVQLLTDTSNLWESEKEGYLLDPVGQTDYCFSNPCGHYTQQIWASTSQIGCGWKSCSENSPFGSEFPEWTIVVCNYAEAGNWLGEIPYVPQLIFSSMPVKQVHPVFPEFPLEAEWIDPESPEFNPSTLLHPHEHHDRETRALAGCTSCTCPTKFSATVYDAAVTQTIRDAIEYAKCLWSCVIPTHPGGIRLKVNAQTISGNVLASAGPLMVSSNGVNWVYCPLNPSICLSVTSTDINMNVDPSDTFYYYGCDGVLPNNNLIDFVSVIMHELGHGLGFSGRASNNNAGYSGLYPFDQRITLSNGSPSRPWNANPLANVNAANAAAISNALVFTGTTYTNGRLFSPTTYQPGSSIFHWDESTYPQGNSNSLMTPTIFNGEVNHLPGELTCDVLASIGYAPVVSQCVAGGASATPSPAVSPSSTRSASASSQPASNSATSTRSISATPSSSSSASRSNSGSSSSSVSRSPSSSNSGSASRSISGTPSSSSSRGASASSTPSAVSPSSSRSRSSSGSPSGSSSRSASASASRASASNTPSRSSSSSASRSASASASRAAASASNTPSRSASRPASPSASASPCFNTCPAGFCGQRTACGSTITCSCGSGQSCLNSVCQASGTTNPNWSGDFSVTFGTTPAISVPDTVLSVSAYGKHIMPFTRSGPVMNKYLTKVNFLATATSGEVGIGFRHTSSGSSNNAMLAMAVRDIGTSAPLMHFMMWLNNQIVWEATMSYSVWSTTGSNNITVTMTFDDPSQNIYLTWVQGGYQYQLYTSQSTFPNLGQVALYTDTASPSVPTFTKLSLSTSTTLTVSLFACIDSATWTSLFYQYTGANPATTSVQVRPSGQNANCAKQAIRGAEVVADSFIVVVESTGIASEVIGQTFIDLVNAGQAGPLAVSSASIIAGTEGALAAGAPALSGSAIAAGGGGAGGAGGLSGGAIAGIVVGSVAGAVLAVGVTAIVVGAVVVAVVAVAAKRSSDDNEPSAPAPAPADERRRSVRKTLVDMFRVPRGGVDVMGNDPNTHQSISARSPAVKV